VTGDPQPVVCISTADWDAPLWTNKQHLMSRLADAGTPVLYVDSVGLRRPAASGQDAARIRRRLATWRPFARPVRERVLRDSPLVVPLHDVPSVQRLNRALVRARVRRNERRYRLERPVVWTYAPMGADVFDPQRHDGLVYHCVDDLAAYPGVDAEAFHVAERRLVAMADVCVVSSRELERKLAALGPRDLRYWPNPADTTTLRAALPARRFEGEVVVGFIGAVQDHKVDIELVAACAELRPAWRFELVGPVGLGLRTGASAFETLPANVRLGGAVTRDELIGVLAGFSAGMIPYRLNDYTASVFPMKVFEYLAAGLPVVSSELPSLVGEVEHVSFASGPDAFVAAVERAIESDGPAAASARSAYASLHSWEARTAEALAVLAGLSRAAPSRSR
jgi:glycosyltransferase involved in cell wall biosynthesis